MKLAVPALLLALATTSGFDAMKKGALVVERPRSAIAAIVGDCDKGDAIDQQECRNNLGEAAKKYKGKRVVMNLGAGHEKFLKFEGMRGEKARFVWAPLVDVGEGLAFTAGKPQKLSSSGNVVVGQRPFDGALEPGILESDLQRAASLGQIVVEVIGKFGAPWKLSAGEKTAQGVAFDIEAVRFSHARTGKTLAEVVP